MNNSVNVVWFRRDLRLKDNAALYHALSNGLPVLALFIFDKEILDDLDDKKDRRVNFIHQALEQIQCELTNLGSSLIVKIGRPKDVWSNLLKEYKIKNVFINHDYEPYGLKRDADLKIFLNKKGITLHSFKDQVVFEKDEVMKDDGTPYTIFTPYSKKWRAKLTDTFVKPFLTEQYFNNFIKHENKPIPTLEQIGFLKDNIKFPSKIFDESIVKNYFDTRNFPAIKGTSRLSVHLRFGTISIRELVRQSIQLSDQYLTELIWREFNMMILYHFPHVVYSAFKKKYDAIIWRNNELEFQLWCEGKTGFPIVDAGMRELNETGFMHNRVRMIVASFLTKDLLIDWRWGEAYFAIKLIDFELSSNNGGWQWAASTGCDAAPYFRIFNPSAQAKRFDPNNIYIRKWVPEFETENYALPIVDHKIARLRALEVYKIALKN